MFCIFLMNHHMHHDGFTIIVEDKPCINFLYGILRLYDINIAGGQVHIPEKECRLFLGVHPTAEQEPRVHWQDSLWKILFPTRGRNTAVKCGKQSAQSYRT